MDWDKIRMHQKMKRHGTDDPRDILPLLPATPHRNRRRPQSKATLRSEAERALAHWLASRNISARSS